MLVKCGVCGGHVPAEVAVDLPGSVERYCSLRCTLEAEPAAAALALPELPRRILVAVDGSGPSLRIVVEAPARAVAAASVEADLVVLGSRGLGAVSGHAVGSLSQRVLGET